LASSEISGANTAGWIAIYDLSNAAKPFFNMNNPTDALLLAVMARLIRIESMVCSLTILNMKHMTAENLEEYRSLARWLGALRARIVETSVKSHAEQFPELAKFLEEHVELSERDLTEMFERSRDREE
jgi:hypothetical protein